MFDIKFIFLGLFVAALTISLNASAAGGGHDEAKPKEEAKAKAEHSAKPASAKDDVKAKQEVSAKAPAARDEPKSKAETAAKPASSKDEKVSEPAGKEASVRQLASLLQKGQATGTIVVGKVQEEGDKGKHAAPAHAAPVHSRKSAAARAHGSARKAGHSAAHAGPLHPAALKAQELHAALKAKEGHDAEPKGPAQHGDHGPAHWAYEGENGPQAWSKIMPEFGTCSTGTRQSPIHIEEDATLQGPAEPLQVRYQPSSGSVVNNGHTIQVDVQGDNVLNVRGTEYRLVQFHAHHPAEERIDQKGFAMVMHLVHKSAEGKLAVIAVLLDPGQPNPLIQKVWTHMPLDAMDRVRLPANLVDLNELLPQDRRYFQFIGSLTTPPCSEGVLWIVLKQPVSLSREQLRMFSRIFPNNARPVQPINGRLVRSAQ